MIRYIDYTNWKDKRSWRKIQILHVFFGHDQWHKENQILVHAIDLEKNEPRTFAFEKIHMMFTEEEFMRFQQQLQPLTPYTGLPKSNQEKGKVFEEKLTLDISAKSGILP